MYHRARHHGIGHAAGCDHLRLGGFNKLFPELEPRRVGREEAREEAELLGAIDGPMHDPDGSSPDGPLPAGYVFLAQLVDHDMVLGTGSDLGGEQWPAHKLKKLANLRSPSLDLHCLYGFGPGASPHLYDPSAPGFLVTGPGDPPHDVARSKAGVALIGDPRNDENLVTSQLHLLFIRFANKVFARCRDEGVAKPFLAAQVKVRHHYQYLVVHDLLKRVCDPTIFSFAIEQLKRGKYPVFYRQEGPQSFPIPVELSGAVARFGHTLLRSSYPVNDEHPEFDLMDRPAVEGGIPGVAKGSAVEWKRFFALEDGTEPAFCKAFGLRYSDPLVRRLDPETGSAIRSLASRDLLRGHVLGLPNGNLVAQELAKAKYPIDPEPSIRIHEIDGWSKIDADVRRRLITEPPLLFYVLREAEVLGDGQHLGPVGSAILLETFFGILSSCKTSFLNPKWKFALDTELAPRINHLGVRVFEAADLVRYAEA